jgi:AhpC/TSA family protein
MKRIFALTASLLAVAIALGLTSNEPAPLEIGQPAPDFTLTDLDGNEHTLSEYAAKGQTVVLEWFSPLCPFVKKHYRDDTGTMLAIQNEHKDDSVVWLRINSSRASHPAGDPELNTKTAKKWGITTPILLDPAGTTGLAYRAKRTPEMYIINPQGILVYHGAIDNDAKAVNPGKINYVRNALGETLAGKEVTKPTTKPYGCTIKY